MTRDAKKQSVKCDNGHHQWTRPENPELDRYTHRFEVKRIICAKCGANPNLSQLEQIDAVLDLHEILKPGDTIYTTLRHVSRSGMQRVIDVNVIRDNEPRWIGYTVAKALGDRFDDRKQGIVVGGCGMDMGFHIVHNLGYRLYGQQVREGTDRESVKLRKQLLEADKFYFTQGGTPAPDPTRPGQVWFGGAGYAFKHRWL